MPSFSCYLGLIGALGFAGGGAFGAVGAAGAFDAGGGVGGFVCCLLACCAILILEFGDRLSDIIRSLLSLRLLL